MVRLDRDGHTVSRIPVRVGTVLQGSASVLLELDAGAPTVVASAAADQLGLVRAELAAEIHDEAQNVTVPARVVSVAATPSRVDGADRYEVRLRFTGRTLAPTGSRTVRVTTGATAGASAVLAVPVTAVYSRPDGTLFVTVVMGRRTVDVTVQTGRRAGGWVEVRTRDDRLGEGSEVVVGTATGGDQAPGRDGAPGPTG